MDSLHLNGVSCIQWLQSTFEDQAEAMLLMTKSGDPRFAFLCYFPLVYMLHQKAGVGLLWVAVISEWLNAVFKWMLVGQRPYWWVMETELYTNDTRPALLQFRYTCELGPGSPSGHAMVTGAVLYIMVSTFIQQLEQSAGKPLPRWRISLWAAFLIFMAAVGISRCFIATHFPHQVVAGTIVGTLLGMLCERYPWTSVRFPHYVAASAALLLSGYAIFYGVRLAGLDPMWSMTLGAKHCARREWVHLDTTLFHALVRDASTLFGVGVGLHLPSATDLDQSERWSPLYLAIGVVAALGVSFASEYIRVPGEPVMLYYIGTFIRYMVLSYVIVKLLPWLICCLGGNNKHKLT